MAKYFSKITTGFFILFRITPRWCKSFPTCACSFICAEALAGRPAPARDIWLNPFRIPTNIIHTPRISCGAIHIRPLSGSEMILHNNLNVYLFAIKFLNTIIMRNNLNCFQPQSGWRWIASGVNPRYKSSKHSRTLGFKPRNEMYADISTKLLTPDLSFLVRHANVLYKNYNKSPQVNSIKIRV